jgi:hypothetical protein
MTKTFTSKAGLALAAAAAISLCVPAVVEAAPTGDRRYASHARPAPRHHQPPPPRHGHYGGAGLGLVLGVVAISAIIAAESQARQPVVYVAPAPTYVEPPPVAQSFQPGYWYFCQEANAYYPYVQQCPGPWQQVIPQPPAPGSN